MSGFNVFESVSSLKLNPAGNRIAIALRGAYPGLLTIRLDGGVAESGFILGSTAGWYIPPKNMKISGSSMIYFSLVSPNTFDSANTFNFYITDSPKERKDFGSPSKKFI